MNNQELISLLCETASELLQESSGRNGQVQRYYEERAKLLKKQNDDHDEKVKEKRKMYARAGYLDKAPSLSNRLDEEHARAIASNIKGLKKQYEYGDLAHHKDAIENELRNLGRSGDEYDDADFSHVNIRTKAFKRYQTEGTKKLHKRINDRTKSQNESIALLLIEAAQLLSEEE